MEIQYYGLSCFRLRGKKAVILFNPFNSQLSGLKIPPVTADIVVFSHRPSQLNSLEHVDKAVNRSEPFVIDGPGEFEAAGTTIFGFPASKNTLFTLEMEGVKFAHLGQLNQKLSDEQLVEINGVDVLFVPVGGSEVLNPSGALEVITQVEPKIAIPMFYSLPGLKVSLAPVEDFLKEAGAIGLTPLPKINIARDKLLGDRQIIVLNRRVTP